MKLQRRLRPRRLLAVNPKTFLVLSLLFLSMVRFGAQTPATVEGLVVNVLTGTPVPSATVTLSRDSRLA